MTFLGVITGLFECGRRLSGEDENLLKTIGISIVAGIFFPVTWVVWLVLFVRHLCGKR